MTLPKSNAPQPTTATKSSARQPYEPPKATFVPLKIEERLLACGKTPHTIPAGRCAAPSAHGLGELNS